jgi:hypothetical protein
MTVKYSDKELGNPYTAQIEIVNLGRAITKDLFQDGRGIEWDVGAPIERFASDPGHEVDNKEMPVLDFKGSRLILKPGLIAKGDTIHATLLTEGPAREARVAFDPFANVKVSKRDEGDRRRSRDRGVRAAYGAISVGIVASVLVGAIHIFGNFNNHVQNPVNNVDNSFNREFAQSFDCPFTEPIFRDTMLSLNLAFRDINIERDAQGKPVALHFAVTYPADLKEATLDATIFVYDYKQIKADGAASTLPTPSDIPSAAEGAVIALKRLPNERISKANLDIQIIAHTMNRLSALSALSLWCNGAYTHLPTPSEASSRRS